MKQGENEAKCILKKLGLCFDETYCDDNSKESMPDLKTIHGRYIEVTHTDHNNAIPNCKLSFQKKSVEERNRIGDAAFEAYKRHQKCAYEKTENGEFSKEALLQIEKDNSILKDHYGLQLNGSFSEWNCDFPTIELSPENILDKIKRKNEKYSNGQTDLFIFVTEDEYRLTMELLKEFCRGNGATYHFIKELLLSHFDVIYLCKWNFETQEYYLKNSELLVITKESAEKLSIRANKY